MVPTLRKSRRVGQPAGHFGLREPVFEVPDVLFSRGVSEGIAVCVMCGPQGTTSPHEHPTQAAL